MSRTGLMGRIALEVLLWTLSILLVMVFARAGWDKFDEASGWAQAFRVWGYPVWFRVLIGVLEVSAAALLVGRIIIISLAITMVAAGSNDHTGRIARLVCTEGAHAFVAVRDRDGDQSAGAHGLSSRTA